MKSPGNPFPVFLARRGARRHLLQKGAVLSVAVGALTLVGCGDDDDDDQDEIAPDSTSGSTSPRGGSTPGESSRHSTSLRSTSNNSKQGSTQSGMTPNSRLLTF